MSRRFADVGVKIPAARLRAMIEGAEPASKESIDVSFALAAGEFEREQRAAKARRARRRLTQLLIVVGLMIAALNLLICMGYVIVSLTLHQSPL